MTTLSLDAVLKNMGITDEDKSLAARLVESTPAFIGGSYLVCPEEANDIDVVISETDYWMHEKHFAGFVQNYSDEYSSVYELMWTSRKGRVNLLVVHNLFSSAYHAAADVMTRSPYEYQTKKERIALHQKLKNIIREAHGIDLVQIEE